MNEGNASSKLAANLGQAGQKARVALADAARSTKEKLGEGGRQARDYCHAMEDSNYDYVTRHPAASLAAVAAVGAAVGYLLGTRSR
ncbi:hypothetical protein [Chitinimonas naiadis]